MTLVELKERCERLLASGVSADLDVYIETCDRCVHEASEVVPEVVAPPWCDPAREVILVKTP